MTIRLTRLDPTSTTDKRVAQTIQKIRDMGIRIELGDQAVHPLTADTTDVLSFRQALRPTRHVNLDLSVLIALVSDITHDPLPENPADAERRFFQKPESVGNNSAEGTPEIELEHSPGIHAKQLT